MHPFQETQKGIVCPRCKTRPRRFYLDVSRLRRYGLEKRLYSDSLGRSFVDYDHALQELSAIRAEIGKGTFDPGRYSKRNSKVLIFENYVEAWLERREQDQQRGQLSLAYLQILRGWCRKYYAPFFKGKNVRDITEAHLEDFYRELPIDLKAKTVHNILAALRKLFKDASRRRDILRMPEFPTVELDEPETLWLKPGAQEEILAQVTDPVYRVFFTFLRY